MIPLLALFNFFTLQNRDTLKKLQCLRVLPSLVSK